MIPVWPDDLPRFVLVDGFQSSPRGTRLKTAMDIGPGKQRRRGPKIASQSSIIDVDSDQRARFERFWDEDVAGGSLPFLIRDHLSDGRDLSNDSGAPLLSSDGLLLIIESWNLVQFGQNDPVYTAIGPLEFRVQFEVVLLP